jgi:hypothetical protein
VLYRSCTDNCRVGILDDEFDIQLRPQLTRRLAEDGLQGVSLSPDGLFVAVPHDGALTITHVYSAPHVSITVPAGPPGSQWRPYYWTRGDTYLVVAQWTHDTVTAVGVVRLGYIDTVEAPTDGGDPRVQTRRIDGDQHLVPTDASGSLDNVVSVVWAGAGPTAYAHRYVRVGPSIYGLGSGRSSTSWARCLRPGESLLGPEGARTTYVIAKDTSRDQRGATIVYRSSDGAPVAVANGGPCGYRTFTQYDLPTSEAGVTWRLLGPLDHTSSLMTRDDGDGSVDLVAVSANDQRVIGHVPAGSEVVAPGMTGGFFD